jgi:CheY-like chemotaxis protein
MIFSNNSQKPILIVEDDPDIRETLQEALEEEGYLVWTAENGQVGYDRIGEATKPSLVLLDLMMPIMDGRVFLNLVMADIDLAKIPVVVISAVASDENTLGARSFIRKPPDLKQILDLAEQYCAS